MTSETLHPDFAAAEAEHQWAGSLVDLAQRLRDESWKLKGRETWYVLPRGATVAMRVNDQSFRKELRVTRRLRRPWSDKSKAAWATELRVFCENLRCSDWKLIKDLVEDDGSVGVDGPGKQVTAVFVEDAPLGAKTALLTCPRCGEKFEPHPDDKLYRNPPCTKCARILGDEEVARRRAERVSSTPPGGSA